MEKIRLEFKLERKEGLTLDRLEKAFENIQSFLSNASGDADICINKNEWVVNNFSEGSLVFQVHGELSSGREKFCDVVKNVIEHKKNPTKPHTVSKQTYMSYLGVSTALGFNSTVEVSVFNNGNSDKLISDIIDTNDAIFLLDNITGVIESAPASEIEYYGEVKGVIHSWFKEQSEEKKPYFKLRDLVTENLINCFYDEGDYEEVLTLFEKKDAIVYIVGIIYENRAKQTIDRIYSEEFRIAPVVNDFDIDRFIGCAPNCIGDEDSVAVIRRFRDDQDD